jgi:hypothetical protein
MSQVIVGSENQWPAKGYQNQYHGLPRDAR